MRHPSIGAALVAVSAALCATAALGTVVTLNDLEVQTVEGQNFTFTFTGLALPDGTGATFILHAQGDYEGAITEALTWTMDGGIVSGGPVGGFLVPCTGGVGGPFDFCHEFQPLGNVEWQRTYPISAAVTNALLSDGTLSIFVDLSNDVMLFDPPNFVEVTFVYSSRTTPSGIPEPAPWALLPLGLAALAVGKRTRARGR